MNSIQSASLADKKLNYVEEKLSLESAVLPTSCPLIVAEDNSVLELMLTTIQSSENSSTYLEETK